MNPLRAPVYKDVRYNEAFPGLVGLQDDELLRKLRQHGSWHPFDEEVYEYAKWFHRYEARCEPCNGGHYIRYICTLPAQGVELDVPSCQHHGPMHWRRETAMGWEAPQKSLPIFGESSEEFAWRQSLRSWRFGQWLNDRWDFFEDLWQIIDTVEGVHDLTPEEVTQILLEEGEGESCADLNEALEQWRKAEGLPTKRPGHACFGFTPLTETPRQGGIYYLRTAAPRLSAIKIGWSKSDVESRIRDLQCAHPWPLHLLAFESGSLKDEAARHRQFADLRIAGGGSEWFRFEGALVSHIATIRREGGLK